MRVSMFKPSVILLSILILPVNTLLAAEKKIDFQSELPASPKFGITFTPPSEDTIPSNDFGDMVRLGKNIFTNTSEHAAQYVGNGLSCVNCHVNNGRQANSAPLWAAIGMYPTYRKKNDRVNTIQNRIQGCFKYSMNGTAPDANSEVLIALITYAHWMGKGVPIGEKLPGRGYPKLKKPAQKPDYTRGEKVYVANCTVCHSADGQGTKVDGRYVFPPLWGKDSFNWGAGMHRINTAAGFIKANMPYGKAGSLSDQQAWDVAYFVNSHDRPQDPRHRGNMAETDKTYHKHQCRYDDKQNGDLLGDAH